MYTILFNQDKELIQTVRVPLFQGERNITELRFLIPQQLEGMQISEFKVVLRYELPNGKKYVVNLNAAPKLYRNYLSYSYPVSQEFTSEAGYIYYSLTILDTEGNFIYKSETDSLEVRKRAHEETVEGGVIWEVDKALFPRPGDSGTIYIDMSTNKIYRWDDDNKDYVVIGSDYMEITEIEDGDLDG